MSKQTSSIFMWLMTVLPVTLSSQNVLPGPGTWDGYIGNDRIVMVANSADQFRLSGYFVQNRGKAVENSHTFSMPMSGARRIFQSDTYVGKLQVSQMDSAFLKGKMTLYNKKKIFFFFRPKVPVTLVRRADLPVRPGFRYQKEIFSKVTIKNDIIYGNARGYWTSSPYGGDPYIEVLAKGIIKTFRDHQPLDLKMDLYVPEADTFRNRPLVMLIHGGAFYVGSKEAITGTILATALAKRGFVVSSIDYRLGFKPVACDVEMSGYRAIQDAHAALRYLSNQSGEIGFNPGQVYVGGNSAGAIASLNVAFMDNGERPEGILKAQKEGLVSNIEESGNQFTDSFDIRGVINMWGAVHSLKIITRDEKIPVLSIHGTADKIVPFGYDRPFQKAVGVNRLLMDKMYGSKPIHDWLQALGIPNRLVALKDQDHEPELTEDHKLNHYMDTLMTHVTRFLYEETAPAITVLPEKLVITSNDALKPVPFLVRNGSLVQLQVEGGVKANAEPADATIIWLNNNENKNLIFIMTNPFNAWNISSFPVTVKKQ